MSRWTRGKLSRLPKAPESAGPGLLFILVALVAVAVAGARLLGFGPGLGVEPVQTRVGPPSPTSPAPAPQAPPAPSAPAPTAAADPPTVLIYHAHATENYGPGQPHAAQGRPGHVVEVGEALAESLEGRGIRAVHHTQIHDHPSWAEAFPRAAQAVGALLQEHDGVRAVIDVHRDAIARDVGRAFTTATIGGRPVARSNGGGDRGGRLRGESAFADQSLHGCGEFAELIGASAEAAPGSQDVEGHVDG
ncbi:MAG: stage II sporulation protein P, partial [Limnochordales bacterium]